MELFSPRLRLREFVQGDYLALREMDSRPEMHTYERELPSEADTHKSLDEYLKDQLIEPRMSFKLAITIPLSNTVRGLVKLSRQWDLIRVWEVAWAVYPDEWGRAMLGRQCHTGEHEK